MRTAHEKRQYENKEWKKEKIWEKKLNAEITVQEINEIKT
jgi:hypothetical protein